MKTLDCDHRFVAIRLPPCAGSPPTAELMRLHHTSVPLVVTSPTVEDDGLYHFTFPEPFPAHIPYPARGVWKLSVTTGCGCYEALVYVNCPAPMFEPVHTPTAVNGPSIECCLLDTDIIFDVTSLSPPTIDVPEYSGATLLVDDAAAYAVRLNSAVTGQYQWIDDSGIVLASGTYGANGTTQYHDIELTCATYALRPVVPAPEEE